IAGMEFGRFVARPVEDDEFAVLCRGDQRGRAEQRRRQDETDADTLCCLHVQFPFFSFQSVAAFPPRWPSREKCLGNAKARYSQAAWCAVSRVTSSVPIISRSHRPSSMAESPSAVATGS